MILILSLDIKRANKAFVGLILLQAISFFSQFFVGRDCQYQSLTTFLNLIFINLNLVLILLPWKYVRVRRIVMPNRRYLPLVEKIMNPILWFNLFLNIVIGVIVFVMIPDIADLKLDQGFHDLYDDIPFFGIFFRIANATQGFGFIAIPLIFYHFVNNEKEKAYKAIILSSSTLVSAIATYSRAGMFAYFFSFLLYYFLIYDSLPNYRIKWINRNIKKASILIIGGFLIMTFVRFSSPRMGYYGDRIPSNSLIKDPIVYSIFDYSSQGYPNGVECLEFYKSENCLNGERSFYFVYMALNYFHILKWDADEHKERVEKASSGNFHGFKGYVASTVIDFGYVGTLIIDLLYYLCVVNVFRRKDKVRLNSLIYSFFLLQGAINSIFYNNLSVFLYPVILLLVFDFVSSIRFQSKKRNNEFISAQTVL